MHDFIPESDGRFDAWQANYRAFADAHGEALGLTEDELKDLDTAADDWRKFYDEVGKARSALAAAIGEKRAARRSYEQLIRRLTAGVQVFPTVTDADRAALGITIRDATPSPVPAPTSVPVVRIEAGQRLRHTLRFTDSATPTRAARPGGVIGAEIRVALTPPGAQPPADASGYTFVRIATRSPVVVPFGGADAGKTAYYLLRWVSTRGEFGPWGAMASATVGG